tara:strand:- start:6072 stop:6776 length:705 start_codon:yes stop_codon:yes gene_type:complete
MWSGPRNLSTALMYSFAARGDCAVWDEPFYAPYLAVSGRPHPMAAEIIATHEADPARVSARCKGPIPQEQRLFYQKQMPHHMLPEFDLTFMSACTNVFLIRHPARVIASYARKMESAELADIGFAAQAELFEREANRLGRAPIVIDCFDIRADPKAALGKLCKAIGIPFSDRMLTWPAGGHVNDGIWARHWYGAVHRSTGFEAVEGPVPGLTGPYAALAEAAMPYYSSLERHKI